MKCRVCGGLMHQKRTVLPFKVGESTVVIVKDLSSSVRSAANI
jgi:hypothetical protein